jgi:hypothetical protein
MKTQWFEVDRKGLAKILERRGKSFAILELIQNAFDEDIESCAVRVEPIEGTSRVRLTVEDDSPEGWRNLSDAFTLFADSKKKTDPTKRGRFNLGEKLLIAICDEVRITSTVGGLLFDTAGRHGLRTKRESGTIVECVLKLTAAERAEVFRALNLVIPPRHIRFSVNGSGCCAPSLTESVTETLQTEIADPDGNLRRSSRQTPVEFYHVAQGETSHLFELGIPVCEIDGPLHVNVCQKIPLTLDREAVQPAFLKRITEITLKHCHAHIVREELQRPWAETAAEAHDAPALAVERVVAAKFGEKRVSFDLSDREANALAVTSGYTVVHGGAMSSALWNNVRNAKAILPAGQVTPSPKPYSEHGKPLRLCSEVTEQMHDVRRYAQRVAELVLSAHVEVRFAAEVTWPYAATYGPCCLTFNVGRLGKKWFDMAANRRAIDDLIIHEFGHHYEMNHLSENYYESLTKIAAHMLELTRQGKI